MRYEECLEFLDGLGHELHAAKFGLESITALLEALGNPERRYPTAIVAGTNGKGSTSAMLASILECAGLRAGLYTSPHLVRVNERIRVGGESIGEEDFAACLSEVRERSEELVTRGRLDHHPSFFEYLTAAAFLHFARAQIEFAVLEVGMGGRLDATNVTTPEVAVITNVALDHQQFLGQTIAAIAGEKAGVIKPGRPVISACELQEAVEVIQRRCRETGAELIEVTPSGLSISHDADGRAQFELATGRGIPLSIQLPLAGDFQVSNALAAIAAARRLAKAGFSIPDTAIEEGLRTTIWPGRLEALRRQPLVILDGAHNVAAAQEIARHARQQWRGRTLRLIYASMADKAIEEISGILFPLAQEIFLTHCDLPRAADPESILERTSVRPLRVTMVSDPVQALEGAVRASLPEDVVLVAGSLFLVGAVKKAALQGSLNLHPMRPAFASELH
jgi:dihydrofolate synthase / folylpolyglutamate synthase